MSNINKNARQLSSPTAQACRRIIPAPSVSAGVSKAVSAGVSAYHTSPKRKRGGVESRKRGDVGSERRHPRAYAWGWCGCGRSAFTLVELLTVVVIITILAGLSVAVLSGTMQSAKEIKTLGTIQKLDAAILQIFESYEERFETLTINREKLRAALGRSNVNLVTENDVQIAKLHFIRDIMRMEMPCSWDEVTYDNNNTTDNSRYRYQCTIGTGNSTAYGADRPAVHRYYLQAHDDHDLTHSDNDPSAELLFLIIANLNPEALEFFGGNEIGDIDNNGLMDFHDAWGKPIRFIRWVPAFTGTDRQPDVVAATRLTLNTNGTNAESWPNPLNCTLSEDNDPSDMDSPQREIYLAFKQARNVHPDPFVSKSTLDSVARSWFLYPLIVSAGADGLFDLNFNSASLRSNITWDRNQVDLSDTSVLPPQIYNPLGQATGIPEDTAPANGSRNGELNHYDNIHNHRLTVAF